MSEERRGGERREAFLFFFSSRVLRLRLRLQLGWGVLVPCYSVAPKTE